jgi:hypothetical protein
MAGDARRMSLLNPLHRYLMIGKLVALLIAVGIITFQNGRIHKWHVQNDKNVAAREADHAAYQNAQTQAAALNQQQITHAIEQQKALNDAKISHLNSRLQLIADELRKPNAAPQGNPIGTPASPGVEGPCRAFDPAWMCLSPADRLRAAQNEERHDELIDLVIEQSNVDPNKETKP